jgi:hypothetical protein
MTTDVYSKPTDKHQYLSYSSCHPKHCFKSITFSQAIRVKRICFTVETTKQRIWDLRHHLRRREYNDKVIESGFSKASEINRNFIDGWILLACSKNSSSSLSLCIHFMSTSSINRNHERGCLSDERSNCSSRSPIKMLAGNQNGTLLCQHFYGGPRRTITPLVT